MSGIWEVRVGKSMGSKDMRLGSREDCYKWSSAELGKRLGNWTRGNRERREDLQTEYLALLGRGTCWSCGLR